MPWIPSFTVDGGLFAGQAFPYGSLTGFINDYPSNPRAIINGLYCGQSETTLGWDGSFGAAGDQLVAYGLDHKDGAYHYFDGIIMDVKNPEGAQFYKQQLVFEMYVGFSTEMSNTVTIGSEQISVTYVAGTFGIRNIWRREYATPYASPTQTVLAGAARDITFTYVISGDVRALPRGYSNQIFGKLYVPLAFGTYAGNNTEYFGCAIYLQYTNAASTGYTKAGYVGVKHETINDVFMIDFEPEVKEDPNDDPNNPGDEEEGGDGEHNRPVDPIPVPDLPYTGAANAGFITMYKLGPAEMWVFAQNFFTDTVLEHIRDLLGKPMDIFVGCGLVPYVPEGNTMWYPLVGGVYISQQAITKIDKQYAEFDFGSIYIEEYGKNVFDYSPYTKILIWLPYIGYRELPVDEVMGKNIRVKYHCDCLGGDCVAFITTQVKPQGISPFAEVVIAQYNGSILSQVPVGSMDYQNLISNVVNSAIGGVGVMIGSAVGGFDGSSLGSQVNTITSSIAGIVNGMKPNYKRDGVPGSTAGFMSIQYPYIIRHIPNQSLPSNYRNIMGYPSNIGGKLGDGFEGFAAVEDIQLNNIPAMEPEREEIMEYLRKGVII